jgi:hypothetical protein
VGCQRLYTVFKLELLSVHSPGGAVACDKSHNPTESVRSAPVQPFTGLVSRLQLEATYLASG